MYIVIEGQDGTGKDTQAKLLKEYFEAKGQKVVTYAESGTASEDQFVSEIARLNYGSQQDIDHRTRVMLYLVNRYEQWRKIAEPALKNGDIVITTRNWFSTLVYEGYAAGVGRSLITKLHKTVMPESYFNPDQIILLTINEKEQAKRLGTQTDKKWDRKKEVWKSKGDDFQKKVNAGYLKVAEKYDVTTVDASGTIEEVFNLIIQQIENYIALHKSHFVSTILGDSPAQPQTRLSSPELSPNFESSTADAQ